MAARKKLIVMIGVILVQVVAVLVFSVFMKPVREGTPEDFWWCACGVSLDGRERDLFSGIYQPRDGWYIYYEQGIHGQFLYRLPRSKAVAVYPEMLSKLDEAAQQDDAEASLFVVLTELNGARAAFEHNPDKLLQLIRKAVLEKVRHEDESAYQYFLSEEDDFTERWTRIHRYWLNVALECLFFAALTLFAFWPWLRGKGWAATSIHMGWLPFLLLLPYFLGYATWTFTSAGPSGGVLYPYAILPFREISFLGGIDSWCWEAFPKTLEPLSQLLGPMLAVSGMGAPGIASTIAVGIIVSASTRAALWFIARKGAAKTPRDA